MSLSDNMMAGPRDVGAAESGAAPAHGNSAGQSRETEVSPGASSSADTSRLPQPVGSVWNWIKDTGAKMRKAAITVTPAFIVNNSSNFLGFSHVLTEFVMFKSGMKENKLIDNPQNPVNWVVEPVKKIAADVYTNSKSRDFTPKQLLSGDIRSNFKKYVTDTKDATLREANRQLETGKAGSKVSLGNPWQTRTTFVGLVIWTLSALIPEKKDSDQKVEEMATLRTLHPIKYVGERLRQAVWFPEWSSHKRQMIGLGYVIIGICSMLGSWRQRRDLSHTVKEDAELIAKGLKQTYTFNGAYFGTSILSFLGSLPLLFALDENKGYSGFGTIMMGRIPVMVKSIKKKFRDNDPGAVSYTTGMVSFQVENALQALIGGATKLPDGTIVDHEDEKKKAIAEAKEFKRTHPRGKVFGLEQANTMTLSVENNPSTKVAGITHVERAMPERAEQQARGEVAKDGTMVVANGR